MDNEKNKLLKSFGLSMAIVLVVSNIIGSGVFKKVAPMSADLLSPNLVLLAWVLAGINESTIFLALICWNRANVLSVLTRDWKL